MTMNETSNSGFMIRKWNIVIDHSNGNYTVVNEIVYSTEVLKSFFCDYHDFSKGIYLHYGT